MSQSLLARRLLFKARPGLRRIVCSSPLQSSSSKRPTMPLGQHNVKGAPTAWAVDRSDIDGCQSNHHTKTLKEFYSTFTLSHGCGDEAAERQVPRSSPSGSNHNVAGGTSTKVFTAFIGVGSNLGDRIGMIEQACNEMEKRGIRVVRTSSLWETQAMYVVDQDAFVNGVCEVSGSAALYFTDACHPKAMIVRRV